MERQVFQSPEFISYARQSLVLVDVDFPEASAKNPGADGPTSPMNDKWREKLREKFNVGENFPTLVLLNESGQTEFQEAGYSGGGPAEVLRSLQRHAKPPSSLAAPAEFKNIGVEEFAKLAADAQNVILDVRTPQEFDSGHLAGAVNLDFNAPDFLERIKALDRRRTYLVHCASGGRSAKACGKLSQLDFPRLYNLAGGIHAWVKAGQPVVK
jgi:rhodanese-related sulfurtransferase